MRSARRSGFDSRRGNRQSRRRSTTEFITRRLGIVTEEINNLAERDAALEEIATRLGVRAERGRRFAELTSLRVGGAIDWVISPMTEEEAAALIHELKQADIAWRG